MSFYNYIGYNCYIILNEMNQPNLFIDENVVNIKC
jgi:hypothetical protein